MGTIQIWKDTAQHPLVNELRQKVMSPPYTGAQHNGSPANRLRVVSDLDKSRGLLWSVLCANNTAAGLLLCVFHRQPEIFYQNSEIAECLYTFGASNQHCQPKWDGLQLQHDFVLSGRGQVAPELRSATTSSRPILFLIPVGPRLCRRAYKSTTLGTDLRHAQSRLSTIVDLEWALHISDIARNWHQREGTAKPTRSARHTWPTLAYVLRHRQQRRPCFDLHVPRRLAWSARWKLQWLNSGATDARWSESVEPGSACMRAPIQKPLGSRRRLG